MDVVMDRPPCFMFLFCPSSVFKLEVESIWSSVAAIRHNHSFIIYSKYFQNIFIVYLLGILHLVFGSIWCFGNSFNNSFPCSFCCSFMVSNYCVFQHMIRSV